MKAGMAYLPEDRKKEGIIADLSVHENIILELQAKRGMFKLLSRKQMEEFADKYITCCRLKQQAVKLRLRAYPAETSRR